MSTGPEAADIRRPQHCSVCGGTRLRVVIELESLPLTDLFSETAFEGPASGYDLRLLICHDCGHGLLADQLSPSLLYGAGYHFRTGTSATARRGTSAFLETLDSLAPGRQFRCALDIGCNDGYLLCNLTARSRRRVGIDPILAYEPVEDDGLTRIAAPIEEVDLAAALETAPDLVICRHTLEHIRDPRRVLEALMNVASPDALFVFEFPSFDALVARLRFDQIFHQHLQYFTLDSFTRLVQAVGGIRVGHWENYHDWGALRVAFVRAADAERPGAGRGAYSAAEITQRYAIFRRQLAAAGDVIASCLSPLYGYGAAQMLPVLAYHLGSDLRSLVAVLDDDPAKDGFHYGNLPLPIWHAGRVGDLRDASVLVTAVDSAEPILRTLLKRRPRHIIYPLNTI